MADIKKRDVTDKSEAGGCHVPMPAARPGSWLQKRTKNLHSHHKLEIFTAYSCAYERMKYEQGLLRNKCLCFKRRANQIALALESDEDRLL